MAKISSWLGTSPTDSFSDYWGLNHYDPNILIKNDPDHIPDLFEDLQSYSISNDILRLTEENTFGLASSESDGDFTANSFDGESKVRNKNLMWSGTTAPLSTSASSTSSDNGALIPLSFVTGYNNNSTTAQQSQSQHSQSSSSSQQQQQQQQNHQNQQSNNKLPPTVVVVANNKNNRNSNNNKSFQLHATTIKTEPFDDYEQQLQQHNIPNSKTTSSTPISLKDIKIEQPNMQHIPPGASLLRKPNLQQQQQRKLLQQQQQQSKFLTLHLPKVHTSDQLLTTTTLNSNVANSSSNRSSSSSNNNNNNQNSSSMNIYGRPDTPHSLDDESALMYGNDCNDGYNDNDCNNTTGFRHQVDLRACIMGSNNISLTATDPTPLIHHLSQQLQDTSKNQIDLPFIGGSSNRSLAEVLDYINDKEEDICCGEDDDDDGDGDTIDGVSSVNTTCATDKMTNSMRNLRTSGYDSDEESLGGASSISSSLINEDSLCTKMIDGDGGGGGVVSPATSPISHCSSSNSSTIGSHHYPPQQTVQQSYLHSDHSYTRCKDGIDDIGNLDHLETPSDSDEEIDVVSINDKKLPTNPSDKDRRAIQTKVACKFSNSRIVKPMNGGVRNGGVNGVNGGSNGANGSANVSLVRSRNSYEFPYTPASSSPVKSIANSRYPSPASTPYHNQYASTPIIVLNSTTTTTTPTTNSEKSRKRLNGIVNGSSSSSSGGLNDSTIDYALPPYKKCRGKKQQHQQQQHNHTSMNSSSTILKRHYSSDETNDTIEKRNLHNDMERQRRIGLKNLFDMLKKQIPSIKDKERAPKVNILREAAKLCESLTREDEQLIEQRAVLKEQMRTRKELLARLRNMKQE